MPGCHSCEEAKGIFSEIIPEFESIVSVEEVDMMSEQGQALVQKHSVFASPGIIIDDELFSTGGVDKNALVERLRELE